MDFIFYVLIGILALIVLVSITAGYIRWSASRLTERLNIRKLSIDVPIEDYTRTLLDQTALENVEIKKLGFWASLFIGNTYSKSKKKINLAKYTARRTTITNLARACTLVGIAKMDADGQKGLQSIAINRYFNWLPFLLVPLIALGLIVDVCITGEITYITLIFSGVGLVLTLFSFIISIISAKKYKMAYDEGFTLLSSLKLLDENEEKKLKKLFKKWKKLVTIDVFYNTLFMIYYSIQFVYLIIKTFRR